MIFVYEKRRCDEDKKFAFVSFGFLLAEFTPNPRAIRFEIMSFVPELELVLWNTLDLWSYVFKLSDLDKCVLGNDDTTGFLNNILGKKEKMIMARACASI